jgi:hypothetical protein
LAKSGDQLNFMVDLAYNGTFSADVMLGISNFAASAPFLNGSNSRLFFGTAWPQNTFDDMHVEMTPEPSGVAVWSLIALIFVVSRRSAR